METWRYIKEWDSLVSTAYGLSVDDTLPYSVHEENSPPILHLYRFKPSVIVGKYQDIKAALKIDRCKERDIEYNRRSTGGGTVIMGEKTVALGFGISMKHPKMKGGIRGVFDILGGVIINSLWKFGISASFRPKNDIEVNGKKIAGLSASTEVGDALLFHTSLLIDFDIPLMLDIMNTPAEKVYDKGYNCFSQRMTTMETELGRKIEVEEVMKAVKESFEETFEINFTEDQLTHTEKGRVEWFIKKRYNCNEWIFSKRHPKFKMGEGLLKTPGGLLQVYMSLTGELIESLMITGDFFSTSADINKIESALKFVPADRKDIESTLSSLWSENLIYGIDTSMLTSAILKAKENCRSGSRQDNVKYQSSNSK